MHAEDQYMETKLSLWLEIHRPAEFKRNKASAMQALRRQCEKGHIEAIKRGKCWYVIGDGRTSNRKDNPIFGT